MRRAAASRASACRANRVRMRQMHELAANWLARVTPEQDPGKVVGADRVWKWRVLAVAPDVDDVLVVGIGCEREVNGPLAARMDPAIRRKRHVHRGPVVSAVAGAKHSSQPSGDDDRCIDLLFRPTARSTLLRHLTSSCSSQRC